MFFRFGPEALVIELALLLVIVVAILEGADKMPITRSTQLRRHCRPQSPRIATGEKDCRLLAGIVAFVLTILQLHTYTTSARKIWASNMRPPAYRGS